MQGQTVLITGGARRLGRAAAIKLAEEGFNVIVHYNTGEQDATELCEHIQTLGVSAWKIQAELTDQGECDRLVRSSATLAGPVHHLINNASIFPNDTLDELSRDTLDTSLHINTLVPYQLSKKIKDAGELQTITNLLDTRVLDYDRSHVSYHLSKRVLMSLTSMMALEWAPQVRSNSVAPGLVLPPEGKDATYLQNLAHTNPLNTVGNEADISNAILFLIQNTFITGQTIYVDGGRHLKGRMYE